MSTSPNIPTTAVSLRRGPQGRWLVVPREAPTDSTEIGAELFGFAGLFDGIRESRRATKNARYAAKVASPAYKGPRIVAEGDSWFEYPFTEDLIMALGKKYAIYSLAKAGDSWADIYTQHELYSTIREEKPDIVMLSLGGNEIMGEIDRYVFEFSLDRPEHKYIQSNFKPVLDFNQTQFESNAREILALGAHLMIHGYDYPDPRALPDREGGQWIGPPLKFTLGIDNQPLWRKIVNSMLDQLNARMKAIADKPEFKGRVHYVNLRKTVGTDNVNTGPDPELWNDEIHPTTEGFAKLAKKLARKIDAVTATA